MYSKIIEEIQVFLNDVGESMAMIYGSFNKDKTSSDLDIMFVSNSDKQIFIDFIKNLNKVYKLKTDEEVPYKMKLVFSFDEFNNRLNKKDVDYFGDVEESVKTDNFINRLVQNAFITSNEVITSKDFLQGYIKYKKGKIRKNLRNNINKYWIFNDLEKTKDNYKDLLGFKRLSDYFSYDELNSEVNLSNNVFPVSHDEVNDHYLSDVSANNLFDFISTNNEVTYFSGCLELMMKIYLATKPKFIYMSKTAFFGLRSIDAEYKDLSNDLEGIVDNSLVYICNPNNPTQEHTSRELIIEKAIENPKSFFIIDETQIMFDSDWKEFSLSDMRLPKNVVVIYSLSKILGSPGRRIAVLVGNLESTKRIVSKVGKDSITNDNVRFIQKVKKTNFIMNAQFESNASMEYMIEYFKNFTDIQMYKPKINTGFILVKFISIELKMKILNQLQSMGIQVSALSEYKGMNKHIRITLGPLVLMKRFSKILERILNDK